MSKSKYLYVSAWMDDTSQDGGGISLFEQDPESGELSFVSRYVDSMSIGYFCISSDRRFLYAVDEVKTNGNNQYVGGSVVAFSIDDATGKLTLINKIPTCGVHPNYITIDKTDSYLFITNYGSEDETYFSEKKDDGSFELKSQYDEGSFIVVKIDDDGSLLCIDSLVTHDEIPSKGFERLQSSHHPHSINISPTNDLLLMIDRGCDAVFSYKFDSSNGNVQLQHVEKTEKGFGPRNAIFHPTLPYVYVVCEVLPYCITYRYDSSTGALTKTNLQGTVLPSVMEGDMSNFYTAPHPADLRINGRNDALYISNRGDNSIALFDIDSSGEIIFRTTVPCGGETPRSFAIDPSGKFLYVGNQHSGTLAMFNILENGELEITNKKSQINSPVYSLFY